MGERDMCDEREMMGGEMCDGGEGVPTMNLPPPKRVFSPTPPVLGTGKRVFTYNFVSY